MLFFFFFEALRQETQKLATGSLCLLSFMGSDQISRIILYVERKKNRTLSETVSTRYLVPGSNSQY